MPDSTLYLYTSLTAGSSHIITATSRLETILKANKLPFRALDVATDDAARKLWGRRSKGKKLPGLVKFGNVVGDLEEIEEWNEYGELRMQIESVEDFGDSLPATSYPATSAATTSSAAAPASAPKQSTIKIQNPPSKEEHKEAAIPPALRQAGEEAAAKAKQLSSSPAPAVSTPAPAAAADEKREESKKSEEEPSRTAQATPSDTKTTTAAVSEKDAAESTTVRREKSSVAPEVNSSSSPKGGAQSTPTEAGGEAVGEEAVGGEEAGREGESKGGMGVSRPQRPRLVPEVAAESSANFHADSAQALGLVQHHRGSIVSATSPEEKKKVAQDLRTSVSGAQAEAVESLRAEKATRGSDGEHEETIEEEPAGVDEMAARVQEARI
ncbi:hypothetical protein BDW42DRAFT_166216 [Aspergillus taichungensis]|uniref:Thioredoxin-like protein n=1 Tax=Aspergillus taichungensis TaxID=482145 RepID=A0A2J5HZE6_9EURO|nr:hypothetical protein BDW42DRAFT_166216 [Aspergillus taichungensis]